ncbi:Blp family class II bacteriocin [Enterococcus faecalis]|uniref:Blp family class II bacteriocin n=1 Tax=Streptococcus sp. TaxID=1306 RepID=UPI0019DA3C24|nr:Blp family class II bacteriocin [Streptococcus sp.]EGO6638271.1 hypothetical protein [Enterococcus faecalis]HEL1135440.1 Blp family class II bacteriocin [Streptococcus equi subsp. zooepidemicus]EHQ8823928.1 Blp family class II bacteriocin [Enterococcus faecalis]EHR4134261.1 Blp family class II bacteriocin [Enterococcus faecalis]EIW2096833.1 Blp family class II bacteriocin [Enterococcus faecalis]
MKLEDFKKLELETLQKIHGGDNVNDCVNGVIVSAGVIGLAAATGPVGWLALGALGGAAATAGFATGYSCTALYFEGN